ncbi:hypothetical protein H8959_006980 [Pygathrix nigripes]
MRTGSFCVLGLLRHTSATVPPSAHSQCRSQEGGSWCGQGVDSKKTFPLEGKAVRQGLSPGSSVLLSTCQWPASPNLSPGAWAHALALLRYNSLSLIPDLSLREMALGLRSGWQP